MNTAFFLWKKTNGNAKWKYCIKKQKKVFTSQILSNRRQICSRLVEL